MTTPAPSTGARRWIWAAIVDLAAVMVFALVGRASHDESVSLMGVLHTAWPFLVGLGVGWTVTAAWRRPIAPVRTGLGVWIATVVVGLVLRAVTPDTAAVAFIVVATVTLGLLMVGWRVFAILVMRVQGGRHERP